MTSRRLELAALNNTGARQSDAVLRTLDGSIKRHSALIRKLKTFTASDLDALLVEQSLLKVEKYQQEIACALLESKFSGKGDVMAAVEFCSAVQRRFPEFSEALVEMTRRMITAPPLYKAITIDQRDREEAVRLSRQKPALRLLTEFNLVSLFAPSVRLKHCSLQFFLSDLFLSDKQLNNLSLAVTFCKNYCPIYLDPLDTLMNALDRSFIAKLMNGYYEGLSKMLVKVNERIADVERANREYLMTKGKIHEECLLTKGELSEEKKESLGFAKVTFDRLLVGATALSGLLGLPLPVFVVDEPVRGGIGLSLAREEEEGEFGIWCDEEEKLMYEAVIDVKACVPASMLTDQKDKNDSNDTKEKHQPREMMDMAGFEGDDSTVYPTEEYEEEARVVGGQSDIDLLLNRLLIVQNAAAIDKIILDYLFMHSKYNKGKLLKALVSIPRNRTDLCVLYSRLIATLNPYFPEIGQTVTQNLEREVKRLFRKTATYLFAEKIKTVRYISELVKFRVSPWYLVFGALQFLFSNFTFPGNIELFTTLLEHCGRFMVKTEESSDRVVRVVEEMMKMKSGRALDTRECLMIDNAYFSVYPPERSAFVEIVFPPLERYARYLLHDQLSVDTAEHVLNQLLKYDWTDPETLRVMHYCFRNVWFIRFGNVDCLAWILAELYEYYPAFCVDVVDMVCESVRQGLESNRFRDNQRRLAMVRFLGEVYNYYLVESCVVVDTLYSLIQFGHQDNIPRPDSTSPFDAPYDFFRIRLICTLLDTCLHAFAQPNLVQTLDDYLALFQMYIYSKGEMPVDVEGVVCEVFDLLRPGIRLYGGYSEAVREVNRIAVMQRDKKASGPLVEQHIAAEIRQESEVDSEEDSEDESEYDSESDQEEQRRADIYSQQVIQDATNDADFDAEYAKLMQESLDGRKFERKQQSIDIPLPLRRSLQQLNASDQFPLSTDSFTLSQDQSPQSIDAHTFSHDQYHGQYQGTQQESTQRKTTDVVFSVLTRKGTKQHLNQVALPSTSKFVQSTRTKLASETLEKQEIKRNVLAYESREYSNEPLLDAGTGDAENGVGVGVDGKKKGRRVLVARPRRLGEVLGTSALFQARGFYSKKR